MSTSVNPSDTETKSSPSSIQTEEEFHDMVHSVKKQQKDRSYEDRFRSLEEALHQHLKDQNSDMALTMITK